MAPSLRPPSFSGQLTGSTTRRGPIVTPLGERCDSTARTGNIDAPWLSNGDSFFRVNGVDVIPLVEAELNRRFPGRAEPAGRRACT
jgi:hypothetical protein